MKTTVNLADIPGIDLGDGENPVDYAANLAFFLLELTDSVYGEWGGKLSAADQRRLMGRALGRGTIIINGKTETVLNRVKVCFGLDYDDRNITKFAELASAVRKENVPECIAAVAAAMTRAGEARVHELMVMPSGRRMHVPVAGLAA